MTAIEDKYKIAISGLQKIANEPTHESYLSIEAKIMRIKARETLKELNLAEQWW